MLLVFLCMLFGGLYFAYSLIPSEHITYYLQAWVMCSPPPGTTVIRVRVRVRVGVRIRVRVGWGTCSPPPGTTLIMSAT